MRDLVLGKLRAGFAMYGDLIGSLSDDDLGFRLAEPSNRVGSQLWCVVGGRESGIKSIRDGAWGGFSCSLTKSETRSVDSMAAALSRTVLEFESTIEELEWTNQREKSLLALLEHETMHQGQLIRYLYGMGRESIPQSWVRRWAL